MVTIGQGNLGRKREEFRRNGQPDGRPLSPIFRRLLAKVHRIKFASEGVSVVCNAVFRLTMSCCVPERRQEETSRSSRDVRNRAEIFGFKTFGDPQNLEPKFLWVYKDTVLEEFGCNSPINPDNISQNTLNFCGKFSNYPSPAGCSLASLCHCLTFVKISGGIAP